MHLERKLFLASIILFVVLIGASMIAGSRSGALTDPSTELSTLTLGRFTVHAEVVQDEASRSRGLGGRTTLAPDSGMLFIFDSSDLWGIWMKDMKISIDVLWLNESGKIVSVEENMLPETYPKIFFPTTRSRYVLELPQGTFRMTGASLGDSIDLSRIVSSK